ncbi:MAG TPA: saccharopine dehydrogenase NADP-binding domain-containing protein [Thermoleophilaceae bacterium]|jgi:hypothetical protein
MRVGIVGAYGAVGEVLAGDLLARTDLDLLVGGRDARRAGALADRLGPRARGRSVDVFDESSLRSFAAACDVVVNCAGPSHFVRDRAVRPVIAEGRHFVDVGGAELTFPELTRTWDEPERAGLAAIVDAGWIPGLSGVFAHHVARRARERLGELESVELWYGDRTAWSVTGFVDIVELVRMRPGVGTYEGGRFVPARPGPGRTLRRVRLPEPFGSATGSLSFASELTALAEASPSTRFATWAVPLLAPLTGLAMAAALTPLGAARPVDGARLVAAAAARDPRASDGGFLAVAARGAGGGRSTGFLATRESVRLTGLVGATAVRMLADGRLSARGCRYLCDAVDPAVFMAELAAVEPGWRLESP